MIRTSTMLEVVAGRRTRRKIGVLAAAAVAVGASPAAAQYGTDAPLPPLPALQGPGTPARAPVPAAAAPAPTTAPRTPPRSSRPNAGTSDASSNAPGAPANRSGVAGAPASNSGVAGALGSGEAVPAAGSAGEIRNTGVDAPIVRVVSSERAEPVLVDGDLPFTGARIGLLAAIGAGLLALGLGVRRRSPAAKP